MTTWYDIAAEIQIQKAYWDMNGEEQTASEATIQKVLKAMGCPTDSLETAKDWLSKREGRNQELLKPYYISLPFKPIELEIYPLPKDLGHSLDISIHDENGEAIHQEKFDLPEEFENSSLHSRSFLKIQLRAELPLGYFQVRVSTPSEKNDALLVSSPERSFIPENLKESGQTQGVFAPLYALHDKKTLGIGSLREASILIKDLKKNHLNFLGFLPLYASFLEEPAEISPYTPVSKLAWNDLFLDLKKIEGIGGHPSWPSFEKSCLDLKEVDDDLDRYHRFLKIRDLFLRKVFAEGDWTSQKKMNPDGFAAFRGAQKSLGRNWRDWPEEARNGDLSKVKIDSTTAQMTAHLQEEIRSQLESLAGLEEKDSFGLYMDLPLGVHRDSYDHWKYQDSFLDNLTVGAPPDPFFHEGQEWGFCPLNPVKMEENGFAYFRQVLSFTMKNASILRVDHVMGMHRMFVIPLGDRPLEGVYLRYPHEALHAILRLESHLHRCMIVGEDLGIVPDEVREKMAEGALHRLYVFSWEINCDQPHLMNPAPRDSLVCLGTHDMFPFRGFIEGHDVKFRRGVSWISPEEEIHELASRASIHRQLMENLKAEEGENGGYEDLFLHVMRLLRNQGARIVLANLEDYWGEIRPQNIPATTSEYSNWSNRFKLDLDEIRRRLEDMRWV